MKPVAAVGIGLALVMIAVGDIMGGGSPLHLFNISAALVVLGGTAGVALASTSMEQFKNIPALYKKACSTGPPDYRGELDRIVGFAEKARREGLLALDGEVAEIDDPFVRKGMQLVVDGTDPEVVREILEAELDGMAARHKAGAQPFVQAGGFAPTLGILGTTMHLVVILQNLDKPETLGPMIAAAFIATLIGVASANVIFLPMGARLKQLSQEELHARAMIVEGILSIQAGDNPRVVQEKLITFVPPKQRLSEEQQAEAAAAAKAAAAA